MGLSIGIVGLPNVGKSTLFNALTKAQNAEAANYPFCTIEPNKAVVPVPDDRLAALAKLVDPERIVAATVDFVDIAGLVKGASTGEGLGNQFLAHIRETSAIVHVVRCFDDPDVVHVDGSVNPVRDVEVIETELVLADVQMVEGRIDRLTKKAKGDKDAIAQLEVAKRLLDHLHQGLPAVAFAERESVPGAALFQELGLITSKPVIFCANVDEGSLAADNAHVVALRAWAEPRKAHVIKISAKVEAELVGLDDAERVRRPEGGPGLDDRARLESAEGRVGHPHRLRARLHPRRGHGVRRLRRPQGRGRLPRRRRVPRRRQRVRGRRRRRAALSLQRLSARGNLTPRAAAM